MLRLFLIVCVSLFAMVQTVSMAHAVEHGDDPHDHAGVVCDLVAPKDRLDGDALIAPTLPSLPLPMSQTQVEQHAIKTLLVPTVTPHPPGRAPPTR